MAQVRLGYPEFQKRNAEVLQVTHSTVTEATRYAKFFPMPFPYLCDPDRVAHERYGLELVDMSLGAGLENAVKCTAIVAADCSCTASDRSRRNRTSSAIRARTHR